MKVIDKIRETDEEKQEMVLTIEASAEEVDKYIKLFFKELNERKYEGFRKGKAPRPVLENSVGGKANAMGGVAEKLINEKGWEAIDEAGVIYISEPEFNVDDPVEDGKPFQFTVSGQVKPEMELSSYDPVTVEMPPEQATDAEVELLIQNLREYYYTLEIAEDHAAENGDFVNVIMSLSTEDGLPVRGFSNATRMIELGASSMPKEFTEALIGCKPGEQHTITFDSSAEKGYSHLGKGLITAEVEVVDVRVKILPEVNNELAAKAGSVDVDDLYKAMRYTINKDKAEALPKIMQDRCVAEAAKRMTEEIPDYFMTYVRAQVQNEVMDRIQKDGSNLSDFLLNNGVDGEEFQADIRKQAENRAMTDLTLDAVYRANCPEVTDEDIRNHFSESEDLEEALAAWKDAGRMSSLRQVVARDKAVHWLVDTAEVTVVE